MANFALNNKFTENNSMNLLIRGCAHSGTRYTAKFLNELGIIVGHETILQHGMVTWYYDDMCKSVPEDGFVFLHQTRDALKNIDACQHLSHGAWLHVKKYIDVPIYHESKLYKSMYYYYYWNKMISNNSLFQYCIEDTQQLIDILDLFKIDYDINKITEANQISKTIGHTDLENRHQLTYDILRKEDEDLANKILEQELEYYEYVD